MVNELLPFLGFVEHHPVGSTVAAVVESYSSHGAYVTLGEARGYVPLRLMAEPAPRSARSVMKLGDTVDLVVVSFNATRRSIDLCVPGMEPPEVKAVAATAASPVKRARKKAAAAAPEAAPVKKTRKKATAKAVEPVEVVEPEAAPAKRTRTKKAAAPPVEPAPESPAPVKRTRKKAAAKAVDAGEAVPLPPPEPPATPVKRTRTKKASTP
jgi:hypothetical protein